MKQRIIRFPAVKALSGHPRSTIRLRIQAGLFPKPISLGARAIGWPEAEILSVNAARIAGKTDQEIQALVASLEVARQFPD